jgi:hypothetical protein
MEAAAQAERELRCWCCALDHQCVGVSSCGARTSGRKLLIRSGGGLIEMGEDRIKRAHQLQERDRQRYSRLRSIKKMKALQAKFQNLRMDPTIKSVQADVATKPKRNLKSDRSPKEENDDVKRAVRNDKRAMVVDEVVAQDRIAVPKARDGKSKRLRGHLKG